MEHRELERRLAQQLAVDLDRDLGRGLNPAAATPLAQDVADAVDAAVEQVVEPEKQMDIYFLILPIICLRGILNNIRLGCISMVLMKYMHDMGIFFRPLK